MSAKERFEQGMKDFQQIVNFDADSSPSEGKETTKKDESEDKTQEEI